MKPPIVILLGIVILLLGIIGYLLWVPADDTANTNQTVNRTVNTNATSNANVANVNGVVSGIDTYAECVAAGYPVQESYPERCSVPGGATYTRDIGNELELDDQIRIDNPRPGQSIASPLAISGEARGNWFFEASFPVKLLNAAGDVMVTGTAQAQGEWMTEEFVPFTATLEFTASAGTGTLVLERDNPSGLSENDAALNVPVVFE